MNNTIKTAVLVSLVFAAALVANAQDKKVRIGRLEIDGRPVKARFTVDIITGDKKVYKAKTDGEGFIVPAEVVAKFADTYVGVLITFKKYTLTFFAVHSSNFSVEWKVVGVDTEPFAPELLGETNSADVQAIYYVTFAGEPERNMVVTVNKPKVTIKKL